MKVSSDPALLARQNVRIVSLNPDLKDHFGHFLALDKALAAESRQRGIDYLVLASELAEPAVRCEIDMVPTFQKNSWRGYVKGRFLSSARDLWACSSDFPRRIRAALSTVDQEGPPPTSIFFMYLAHSRHVAAAIRLGLSLRGQHPIVLNLFYAHFTHGVPEMQRHPGFARFLRWTRRIRRRANVHLCLDSDVLEEHLRVEVPGESFGRLPMFSVTDFSAQASSGSTGQRKLRRVTYPGNLRFQKGYDLVCRLAENFHRPDAELVIRRVVVELTDTRLAQMAKEIRGATVVDGILSPGEYVNLLRESDVLLLPYRRSEFYSRTSGVFADAMVLGKPVVATADTWPGRLVEKFGCGETFRDGDVDDFARAVARVLDGYEEYQERMSSCRGEWLQTNNPSAAVDFLLSHLPG